MENAHLQQEILNNVVSITRGRIRDVISQEELEDIRVAASVLEEGWKALGERQAAIRARLRRGAQIESGPDEFDEATGAVRRNKSG